MFMLFTCICGHNVSKSHFSTWHHAVSLLALTPFCPNIQFQAPILFQLKATQRKDGYERNGTSNIIHPFRMILFQLAFSTITSLTVIIKKIYICQIHVLDAFAYYQMLVDLHSSLERTSDGRFFPLKGFSFLF